MQLQKFYFRPEEYSQPFEFNAAVEEQNLPMVIAQYAITPDKIRSGYAHNLGIHDVRFFLAIRSLGVSHIQWEDSNFHSAIQAFGYTRAATEKYVDRLTDAGWLTQNIHTNKLVMVSIYTIAKNLGCYSKRCATVKIKTDCLRSAVRFRQIVSGVFMYGLARAASHSEVAREYVDSQGITGVPEGAVMISLSFIQGVLKCGQGTAQRVRQDAALSGMITSSEVIKSVGRIPEATPHLDYLLEVKAVTDESNLLVCAGCICRQLPNVVSLGKGVKTSRIKIRDVSLVSQRKVNNKD